MSDISASRNEAPLDSASGSVPSATACGVFAQRRCAFPAGHADQSRGHHKRRQVVLLRGGDELLKSPRRHRSAATPPRCPLRCRGRGSPPIAVVVSVAGMPPLLDHAVTLRPDPEFVGPRVARANMPQPAWLRPRITTCSAERGRSMPIRPADDEVPGSPVLVGSRRVGVWRFGSAGGWPLVWNHGGLSCGLDATAMDVAGRQCGAEIISIDRPGIGRSDAWSMSSIAQWPHIVESVANFLIWTISRLPGGRAGSVCSRRERCRWTRLPRPGG